MIKQDDHSDQHSMNVVRRKRVENDRSYYDYCDDATGAFVGKVERAKSTGGGWWWYEILADGSDGRRFETLDEAKRHFSKAATSAASR